MLSVEIEVISTIMKNIMSVIDSLYAVLKEDLPIPE
jgi:hypothetical protein